MWARAVQRLDLPMNLRAVVFAVEFLASPAHVARIVARHHPLRCTGKCAAAWHPHA
jgi:hypothetical protein